MKTFVYLSLSIALVSAFGGSEDKFLKKYAMMKIYESCFGQDVVKQIRQEMKAACAKCASLESPSSPVVPPVQPTPPPPPHKTGDSGNSVYEAPPNFDMDKLHQAILAYRPNSAPSPFYRPLSPPIMSPSLYSPYAGPPPLQGLPGAMLYPGFPQPNNQMTLYGAFPLIGQPYYGNRDARNINFKSQVDALNSAGINVKVKNITCVMQELGYLDENLEPNYQKILERIKRLPVSDELKIDMEDGVEFCQQFSQCVPDIKADKSPLSRDLIRPMFFFKCYKHKKLEACIMKDVREKYSGVSDEDLEDSAEGDFKRRGKAMELSAEGNDKNGGVVEQLASSMYEFLYGSGSDIDMDGF